jgi:hypothetical protein
MSLSQSRSAISLSTTPKGMPLFRIEDTFPREGIPIDRGTLCRWKKRVGNGLAVAHCTHVGAAWTMLLAHLVLRLIRSAPRRFGVVSIGQLALAGLILFLHVGLAPVSLALSANRRFAPEVVSRSLNSIPAWWSKEVIFVNVPTYFVPYAMNWERVQLGLPSATRTAALGATDEEVEVIRVDGNTIELYSPPGFLLESFSCSWRGSRAPFHVGETIQIGDYDVTLMRVTADGRPLRVRFRSARSLDEPGFCFVYSDGRELTPFRFAPIGQRTIIRAVRDTAPLVLEDRAR